MKTEYFKEIIDVLNKYLGYSTAHYSTAEIEAQKRCFNKIASELASLKQKAPERLPTDEEIEKWAEYHAKFIGFDGKQNINVAKQVSFIQGAKRMRDQIIKL